MHVQRQHVDVFGHPLQVGAGLFMAELDHLAQADQQSLSGGFQRLPILRHAPLQVLAVLEGHDLQPALAQSPGYRMLDDVGAERLQKIVVSTRFKYINGGIQVTQA